LSQYGVIFLTQKTCWCVDKVDVEKPQKFHLKNTSRCGGLGIFLGSLALITFDDLGLKLLVASIPAFLAGFCEDFHRKISPKVRMLIVSLAVILGMILLKTIIWDIGYFRAYFKLPFFIAIPFTIFCVVGVTNAINIIDGLNGLASGISMISLLCFAFVVYKVGDFQLLQIIVVLIFAIVGFFIWNFPKGKIFLDDGGAYFLGFFLGRNFYFAC